MSVTNLKIYGRLKQDLRLLVISYLSEHLALELIKSIENLYLPLVDKKYTRRK